MIYMDGRRRYAQANGRFSCIVSDYSMDNWTWVLRKGKVKLWGHSLEQVETIVTLLIIRKGPSLTLELFGLWQSQGHTFRKVTLSSLLPINTGSLAAHVEPYFHFDRHFSVAIFD